jgi:hypothetical protein
MKLYFPSKHWQLPVGIHHVVFTPKPVIALKFYSFFFSSYGTVVEYLSPVCWYVITAIFFQKMIVIFDYIQSTFLSAPINKTVEMNKDVCIKITPCIFPAEYKPQILY